MPCVKWKIDCQIAKGIGYEWTGISLQEKQSESQMAFLLALSMLVVFLVLAALYESWAIPLSVMLVVPLGILVLLRLCLEA
jgi:multidrug efflux pump